MPLIGAMRVSLPVQYVLMGRENKTWPTNGALGGQAGAKYSNQALAHFFCLSGHLDRLTA